MDADYLNLLRLIEDEATDEAERFAAVEVLLRRCEDLATVCSPALFRFYTSVVERLRLTGHEWDGSRLRAVA